ncbi:Dbl homology domain-containing protein [Mycena vitilis]|nr:Dbl homology domain-containing protein [Mycena vitilis]
MQSLAMTPEETEDRRRHLIRSLVKLEKNYVCKLEALEKFETALSDSGLIGQSTMRRLFFNIKQLLPFQRKFFAKMKMIEHLPWQEQRWGELFLESESDFGLYESYCFNWSTSRLPDMCFNDTRVSNRVEQMRESLAVFETDVTRNLPRALCAPVSHFHTYPRLLEPLLDACSTESYAHYDELKNGLAAVERVIERVSVARHIAIYQHTVATLCVRVVDWQGHQVDTFGALLLDDEEVFGVVKDGLDPQCQAFLFERVLLFCVRPLGVPLAHPNLRSHLTPLRVESVVLLVDVVQAEVMPSPHPDFPLDVRCNGADGLETFTLRIESQDKRSQWELKINQLAGKCAERIADRDKHAQRISMEVI